MKELSLKKVAVRESIILEFYIKFFLKSFDDLICSNMIKIEIALEYMSSCMHQQMKKKYNLKDIVQIN